MRVKLAITSLDEVGPGAELDVVFVIEIPQRPRSIAVSPTEPWPTSKEETKEKGLQEGNRGLKQGILGVTKGRPNLLWHSLYSDLNQPR